MCQPPPPQPKRKRGRRGRRRDGAVPKQLNPLKPQFCEFAQRWGAWRQRLDTSKPLVVDVGCGEGEWCAAAAAVRRDLNFLGVDVRALRLRCDAQRERRQIAHSYPRTRRPATWRGSWRSGATPAERRCTSSASSRIRTGRIVIRTGACSRGRSSRRRRRTRPAQGSSSAARSHRPRPLGLHRVGDALVAADAPADLLAIPTERAIYATVRQPSAVQRGRLCADRARGEVVRLFAPQLRLRRVGRRALRAARHLDSSSGRPPKGLPAPPCPPACRHGATAGVGGQADPGLGGSRPPSSSASSSSARQP